MSTPAKKKLFLSDQKFTRLNDTVPVKDRKGYVCGFAENPEPQKTKIENPYREISRTEIIERFGKREPGRRVAVAVDAGLGKTTNIHWLQYALLNQESPHLTLIVDLADASHLEFIRDGDPDLLHRHLRSQLKKHLVQSDQRIDELLEIRRKDGGLTILIDGLDHALTMKLPGKLLDLMNSPQWKSCSFWIAGRPYAFEQSWDRLFANQPEWQFLWVEPLESAEVRFYLHETIGIDCYDQIPQEGRQLLANPRLLVLLAKIIKDQVTGQSDQKEIRRIIQSLRLRTAADVYAQAYFRPGRYPQLSASGAIDSPRGLIGMGLTNKSTAADDERQGPAFIGLADGERPTEHNYHRRIERTAALLGAIAFQMFAENSLDPSSKHKPHPNLVGINPGQIDSFQSAVQDRLARTDPRKKCNFHDDFVRLGEMNTQSFDFVVFKGIDQKGIAWHDPTVQAFFAAYWVAKHGNDEEFQIIRRWIDFQEERLEAFTEFWRFLAAMPVNPEPEKDSSALRLVDPVAWQTVFAECYWPEVQKKAMTQDRRQFTREMIYYSQFVVSHHATDLWNQWRKPWTDLVQRVESNQASDRDRKLHQELARDYVRCPHNPANDFKPYRMGGDGEPVRENVVMAPFQINIFQVTNIQYELFEPFHQREKTISDQDDQPVVNVTFWDAAAFAVFVGSRLPSEEEWEYACRAGTTTRYWFGNSCNGTQANCDGNYPVESEKGPYLERTVSLNENNFPQLGIEYKANPWGLWHVHGNVWEWTSSNYSNNSKTLRGGSWSGTPDFLAAVYRGGDVPSDRGRLRGFRLVSAWTDL
jgi:hypothetical protein